jgi:hypothetical protein
VASQAFDGKRMAATATLKIIKARIIMGGLASMSMATATQSSYCGRGALGGSA